MGANAKILADYGKFGKLEKVDLQEVFNDSVLLAAACFHPATLFELADGSEVKLSEIKIGDELEHGGKVYMKLDSISNDLYLLNGDLVSGNHAVYNASGNEQWDYVKNCKNVEKVPGACPVISLATENHLMVSKSGVVYSDYYMTDKFYHLMNNELLLCLQEEHPHFEMRKLINK